MDKPQRSIKTRISILFIILMPITIMIVGSIVFYNWKSSVDNMIMEIQDEASVTILDEIEKFTNVPLQINKINHHIIEKRIVDIYDERSREMYFAGVMKAAEDNVYSFSYGTEQGEYYGVRRNEKNQLEVMRSDAKTGGQSQYYSLTEDWTAGNLSIKLDDFDPRTREWYKIAKETQRPFFSSVYKHFVMNDLAISASYPIYDSQGVLEGVLGTHITLSKINNFLEKIAQDKKAVVYIVDRLSGELVANSLNFPNLITSSDGEMSRVSIEGIDNKYIIDAYLNYQNTAQKYFIANTDNGKKFIKVLALKRDGLDWLIITAISENAYTEEIRKSIFIAVILSIFAIVATSFIWAKSLDKYLKPIYDLICVTEKFSSGDLSQRAQVCRNDEVGQLACVFNKMADELCLLINSLEKKVIERTRQLEKINCELAAAKENLEISSQTDFLTNLYNRKFVLEKMEQETKRSNRTKRKFAIIMGDIDYFKKVNDTYGHDGGDLVLKKVAKIMQNIARETDYVSRWGGEEFLLLLPETEDEGALRVAERLRQIIENEELMYGNISLKVTMTLGVAVYNEGMTIDEVIKNADIAVYRGKNNGRNQVNCF